MLRPFATLFAWYRTWVAAVVGYLIGAILMADLVGRLANARTRERVDLRAVGSGNPGGANALANLGPGWGAAVIAGDIAKGALAARAGRLIAGDAGAYAAATGAVAGHCFPPFADFRGGKGVGTSAGTTIVCFPAYMPIDIGLAAASFAVSRHAGKATAVASGVFVAASWLWYCFRLPNLWGTKPTLGLPLYALATTAIIAYKFATAPRHLGDRRR